MAEELMLEVNEDKDGIRFNLSSDTRNVNSVVKALRTFLRRYSIKDDSALVLVVRELLNNAIEHGNKKIEELAVSLAVECIGPLRFKITVEDQGEGFDHATLDLRLPEDPTRIRNRGLALVNAFSDEIDFSDKGNLVSVYISIQQDTYFNITDEDDLKVVQPTSSLTADVADNFRSILLGLMDKGANDYRFDLSAVEDVDSMALSIFVIFANMLKERQADPHLEIVGANPDIANLFKMTRLDKVYTLSD